MAGLATDPPLRTFRAIRPLLVELVPADLSVAVEGDFQVQVILAGGVHAVVQAPRVVHVVAPLILEARVVLVAPLYPAPPGAHPCTDEVQAFVVKTLEVVVEVVGALLLRGVVSPVAHVDPDGPEPIAVLKLKVHGIPAADP